MKYAENENDFQGKKVTFYSDRKWFERSRCCKKYLTSKIIKTSSKINDITEAIQNGKSKSFLSRFFFNGVFFLASSDIVNIWESFLKKSTEKTPYDQMIWKNTWINHFSDGYKLEYLHNEDFFVPLKIKDSIASIIGDKDIVDYNNLLSVNQNFSKFEQILDQVFSLNIKIFQIFSISEKSSTYTLLCNEKLQKNIQ